MRAKQFFYACAGILMLALVYHLGTSRAVAQVGGQFAGISVSDGNCTTYAITSTGDIYATDHRVGRFSGQLRWTDCISASTTSSPPWQYVGNVLTGTVQVEGTSITDVKKKFREEE